MLRSKGIMRQRLSWWMSGGKRYVWRLFHTILLHLETEKQNEYNNNDNVEAYNDNDESDSKWTWKRLWFDSWTNNRSRGFISIRGMANLEEN